MVGNSRVSLAIPSCIKDPGPFFPSMFLTMLCILDTFLPIVKMAAIAPNTMSSHSEVRKQEKKGDRNPHTFLSQLFFREDDLFSKFPENLPKATELVTW